MPQLEYYGRKWKIGNDNLMIPSMLSAGLRGLWLILLLITILGSYDQIFNNNCNDNCAPLTYFLLSLFCFFISIFIELRMSYISLQGAIPDTKMRQEKLSLWMTLHIITWFIEFIILIWGIGLIVGIFGNEKKDYHFNNILLFIIVLTQAIDISLALCCCYVLIGDPIDKYVEIIKKYPNRKKDDFDPEIGFQINSDFIHANRNDSDRFSISSITSIELEDIYFPEKLEKDIEMKCKRGLQCFRFLSCNLFGGKEIGEDFSMVARVLSRSFHDQGLLNIVASDVLAGLILLRHSQKSKERIHISNSDNNNNNIEDGLSYNVNSLINQNESKYGSNGLLFNEYFNHLEDCSHVYRLYKKQLLRPDIPEDRRMVHEIGRLGYFALSIYSWRLFLYMNPICGLCNLCTFSLCGLKEREDKHIKFEATSDGQLLHDRLHKFYSAKWEEENEKKMNYLDINNENIKNKRSFSKPLSTTKEPDPPNYLSRPKTSEIEEGCIRGDNILHWNESALLKISGLEQVDIVYAHFENKVGETPYCILVDHQSDMVVVSIRGTLSLEDCITDTLATPVELGDAGQKWNFPGDGEYAHFGMYSAALWIKHDLSRHRILNALLRPDEDISLSHLPLKKDCRNYHLRIIGHSLGAGTASILSLFLRSEWPQLQCLAFSPPGAIFSKKIAEYCNTFITSIVVGMDLVPRSSVTNFEKLRRSVLEHIARCKVNKWKVISSALNQNVNIDDFLWKEEEVPVSTFTTQIYYYLQAQKEREKLRPTLDLYPAGRIIYYVKIDDFKKKCCGRKRIFYPIWSNREDFDEVLISPSMMWDHFPDNVAKAVSNVDNNWEHNYNYNSYNSEEIKNDTNNEKKKL